MDVIFLNKRKKREREKRKTNKRWINVLLCVTETPHIKRKKEQEPASVLQQLSIKKKKNYT